MGSLCFGSLFLLARYREYMTGGVVGFSLDKAYAYTKIIFVARRAYLAVALLLSFAVVVDGIGSGWSVWAIAFGLSFLATVPLHIMHRQLSSMLSEALTLYILAFGSWAAFVV